ncbi:MAG: carbon monoxide dehydrogenase subunit G [Ectothiorhodospiraceae bacterium]|jgi:carbon monoxide dehydrogenase subunit G
MDMNNERQLPLPQQQVWEALNDPEVLAACIPGCESMEEVEENVYRATVTQKVGPVKARFKGRVTVSEQQPPSAYRLSFEGDGGSAGFAKGEADVTISEEGDGSRIGYTVKATVGGKLAQVGSRLVDGAARKTADKFFDNLVEHLGGGEEAAKGGEAEEKGAEAPQAAAPSAQPEAGGSRAVWGVAAVVVILLLVILYLIF